MSAVFVALLQEEGLVFEGDAEGVEDAVAIGEEDVAVAYGHAGEVGGVGDGVLAGEEGLSGGGVEDVEGGVGVGVASGEGEEDTVGDAGLGWVAPIGGEPGGSEDGFACDVRLLTREALRSFEVFLQGRHTRQKAEDKLESICGAAVIPRETFGIFEYIQEA